MTKQIIIQRKGYNEWSAHLREGGGGMGLYASSAAEAEAKLRDAYDCEGIEAEVVESIFDRNVATDANGMLTQDFTPPRSLIEMASTMKESTTVGELAVFGFMVLTIATMWIVS